MSDVVHIGRCLGCDKCARLDGGVCMECLSSPRRGRRWAELANRCRTEPEFALAVYAQIRTDRARAMFLSIFGAALLRAGISSLPAIRQRSNDSESELVILPPPPDD